MLGLHCSTQPSSICSTQAYCSGFSCCGAPTLGLCASVVGIQGLINCGLQAIECTGFSSCGTWAQLFCALWNLPRPGIEPVSPALAGRFPSTVPPGKFFLSYPNNGHTGLEPVLMTSCYLDYICRDLISK